MALNLKWPEGVGCCKRLAAKADVVVENFRPDVKQRLGIDYEALAAVNPRIIFASISGFGQDGPYAERPGFDQIAPGHGRSDVGDRPSRPGAGARGIAGRRPVAGLYTALGVMVALLEREESGKGQWVRYLAAAGADRDDGLPGHALDDEAAKCREAGRQQSPDRRSRPACSRPRDGVINIAAAGQEMWEKVCETLAMTGLAKHPDYATGAARSKNRDALNAAMEKETVKNTSAHWVDAFNKAGVPCGPIYTVDQTFADAQVKHLGIAKDVRTQSQKTIRLVGRRSRCRARQATSWRRRR